jgi:phage shock protein C
VKRLYKSRHDTVLDGVCGGIANYFNIDPLIVRLIWVIVTIVGGITIIFSIFIYILAAILIPREPTGSTSQRQHPDQDDQLAPVELDRKSQDHGRTAVFFGGLLILFGVVILLNQLALFSLRDWFSATFTLFRGIGQYFVPALLILAGFMILLWRRK